MKTEQTQQHGEAALLAQIAELQKQLDDCLEKKQKDQQEPDPDRSNVLYHRLRAKAENTLRGIFGEIDELSYSQPWEDFQTFLISADSIDHLRAERHFKLGLFLVTRIREKLAEIGAESGVDETHQLYKELADLLIDDIAFGDCYSHNAILKLLECFQYLKGNASYYGWGMEDTVDFETGLEIIERCQRIAMKASKFKRPY
jgi:hypothetical protein